jgi:F-type H+-transporting ATPase subunit delta
MEWLHNPTVSRQEKVKFAQVVAQAMHANRLVANTLLLMAEKGRLAYLPQVERFYAEFADRRAGRLRATVISAVPLENQAVQRMGEIFSRATRQNVTIKRQVDPSIIGGIVAQIGSQLFDGSTRNQLAQLKKQLQALQA